MRVEFRLLNQSDIALARTEAVDTQIFDDMISGSLYIWGCFGDRKLGAIWGVIPGSILADNAYIWAQIMPWAKAYPMTTARAVRSAIRGTLREYPILWGLCEEENHWLRYIGAKFKGRQGKYLSFVIEA